mmetsp:Transcript_88046/g.155911  ORF Transcript_88046/g.155911 Transcript_88046/m.155911 type:complete len:280 (-) Transcript_88046:472-1311(-)
MAVISGVVPSLAFSRTERAHIPPRLIRNLTISVVALRAARCMGTKPSANEPMFGFEFFSYRSLTILGSPMNTAISNGVHPLAGSWELGSPFASSQSSTPAMCPPKTSRNMSPARLWYSSLISCTKFCTSPTNSVAFLFLFRLRRITRCLLSSMLSAAGRFDARLPPGPVGGPAIFVFITIVDDSSRLRSSFCTSATLCSIFMSCFSNFFLRYWSVVRKCTTSPNSLLSMARSACLIFRTISSFCLSSSVNFSMSCSSCSSDASFLPSLSPCCPCPCPCP